MIWSCITLQYVVNLLDKGNNTRIYITATKWMRLLNYDR